MSTTPEPTSETFIVSRSKDPKAFLVSREIIERIPKKKQSQDRQNYKLGGLNFYQTDNVSMHPIDRDDYFAFSLSQEDAFTLIPEDILQLFNFPPSHRYPSGLINSDAPATAVAVVIQAAA